MSAYPDIPVACIESGMVMLLEKVVDEVVLEACVQRIYTEQQKATVEGFPCPSCRIQFGVRPPRDVTEGLWGLVQPGGIPEVKPTGKPSCKYRPLRGPLFVQRS